MARKTFIRPGWITRSFRLGVERTGFDEDDGPTLVFDAIDDAYTSFCKLWTFD